MYPIEAAVKNQSVSLVETAILSLDRGWAGRIDYHAIVKTGAVGTLGITFRWKDRNGVSRSHPALGLSLLTPGPIVENDFRVWTQNANPSTLTVELALAGLVGVPVFDFFANGFGVIYD